MDGLRNKNLLLRPPLDWGLVLLKQEDGSLLLEPQSRDASLGAEVEECKNYAVAIIHCYLVRFILVFISALY